jgi:hypothetical protein
MIEAEGLPRIAGRILGDLLLSDRPKNAAEISADLQISHGSVSTNTRLLQSLGIIERIAVPGDRAASYQLTKDPYGSLLSGQLDRMRRLHDLISSTRKRLGAGNSGSARLAAMERFYRMVIKSTEELLADWVVELEPRSTATASPRSKKAVL